MLEAVDLGAKLKKGEMKAVLEGQNGLYNRLRMLQQACRNEMIPVSIVFEGWDAAGKGTLIGKLVERLDPRRFAVHPTSAPTEEESFKPFLWRFWQNLPPYGHWSIFDRSWYGRVLVERVDELIDERQVRDALREIGEFERQLANDGMVICKFFLHISKKEQRKRFKALEADRFTAWKVEKEDWRHHKQYDQYVVAIEEMLADTSRTYAPWTLVPATDHNWAQVQIFQTICQAIEDAIKQRKEREAYAAAREKIAADAAAALAAAETEALGERADDATATSDDLDPVAAFGLPALRNGRSILDDVDLSLTLTREEYEKRLREQQLRLREGIWNCFQRRVPVLAIYEGWDAGGKGGNIKRLTEMLDPRSYTVSAFAAPAGEEREHQYLWRFWRKLPKGGHLGIFDRSWYGRVLVERVEGFATPEEWGRAFWEINEFERHLTSFGTVLCKFWLHISQEEQLNRFNERATIAYKRYKLTDEDWRNREKWDDYATAVDDMLMKTSTLHAPWTVVEGNCKRWARVRVLTRVCDAIEARLGEAGRD